MNDPKYRNSLAFTDLIFNILIGVFVMFFIAFILISPKAKDENRNVDSLVQYRITIEWEAGNINDVDLWVQDPLENTVWFATRDAGLMHLDRDDRGSVGDSVVISGGITISSKTNVEIFSIRKTIPGEYIANVHLYNRFDNAEVTKIIGKLEQVDPYVILDRVEVLLTYIGEEKLLFRFTLNENGDIISKSKVFTKIVTDDGNVYGF